MASYIYYNDYEEKEIEHSINEKPEIKDSEGRLMKIKIVNGNFMLKGKGFYSTENRKNA